MLHQLGCDLQQPLSIQNSLTQEDIQHCPIRRVKFASIRIHASCCRVVIWRGGRGCRWQGRLEAASSLGIPRYPRGTYKGCTLSSWMLLKATTLDSIMLFYQPLYYRRKVSMEWNQVSVLYLNSNTVSTCKYSDWQHEETGLQSPSYVSSLRYARFG